MAREVDCKNTVGNNPNNYKPLTTQEAPKYLKNNGNSRIKFMWDKRQNVYTLTLKPLCGNSKA